MFPAQRQRLDITCHYNRLYTTARGSGAGRPARPFVNTAALTAPCTQDVALNSLATGDATWDSLEIVYAMWDSLAIVYAT